MHDRTVIIGDPFGAKRFSSTEKAIQELKLEYLGEVTREGKTYHRVRSWAGQILTTAPMPSATGSSTPSRCCRRSARVRPIATSFPTRASTNRYPRRRSKRRSGRRSGEPFKLEEGYDHFTIIACDGSDGRMSATMGTTGIEGYSSERPELSGACGCLFQHSNEGEVIMRAIDYRGRRCSLHGNLARGRRKSRR